MSVFKSLAEEHALLLGLVERLENATADPDARSSMKETRNLLLVLLKALESHEALERLIFGGKPEAPAAAESAALAINERQHLALNELRKEGTTLLQGLPREDAATMRGLSRRLARLLRRHFEDEERGLWPSFNSSAGRSRLHSLDRQARTQVKAMRKEFEAYLHAVEDYLA